MNPTPRPLADVTIDSDYAVVSDRGDRSRLIVVRHKASGTFWSCSYLEFTNGEHWFMDRKWEEVEVPEKVVETVRSHDELMRRRRELIRAVADILSPGYGGKTDRHIVAEQMVDFGWTALVASMNRRQ